MNDARAVAAAPSESLLRWLTGMMFLMFAMTSDAVGSVIPKIVAEFHLSLKAASAFQYAPMLAIGLGALLLGFLADGLGRRGTIVLGLACYGVASLLFAFGSSYGHFVVLLAASGLGIAIFKIGALALVGDISRTPTQHTTTMNFIEGCFGVGSIAGPAIVAVLLVQGLSWKWLYVVAAAICFALMGIALLLRYPPTPRASMGTGGPAGALRMIGHSLRMVGDPHVLGFSLLIFLYVATEVAIYVWMPTYLQSYRGPSSWLPTYALTIFFVLRAGGRFLGVWLLNRCEWGLAMALLSAAILACFAGSLAGGVSAAAWLLPLSGLFMSMLYPTINSKGISCFRRHEHGAAAGVILFFTALSAALAPLAMAAVSDAYGDLRYGFVLATILAALLFAGLTYNWLRAPATRRLALVSAAEAAADRAS